MSPGSRNRVGQERRAELWLGEMRARDSPPHRAENGRTEEPGADAVVGPGRLSLLSFARPNQRLSRWAGLRLDRFRSCVPGLVRDGAADHRAATGAEST